MRKNNGPRTEPCGTPALTDFQTEDWPLRTTCWFILFRNDVISFKRLPSIPLLWVYKGDLSLVIVKLHNFTIRIEIPS